MSASTASQPHPTRRAVLGALGAGLGGLALSGCGGFSLGARATDGTRLRLGYFGNLTHGVPILGLARGTFAAALPGVSIEPSVFNAGPAAVEAVLSEALDAAYLGPSPAINAYVKTKSQGVRIVAGGATGGAALVVRPSITGPEHLRGTTLASPQLGGTQDVALRAWLQSHGLRTDTTGGSDVTVVAQPNAQTLDLFKAGTIDGAWLPEPWVSRLVLDAGATVLVDEKTLWPGGLFPTTQLIVTQKLLADHRDQVTALVTAHVDTVTWLRANRAAALAAINAELATLSGKPLGAPVLARAAKEVTFGWDPVAAAMPALARAAVDAGTATRLADLTGAFDLSVLNAILAKRGQAAIADGGLGVTS